MNTTRSLLGVALSLGFVVASGCTGPTKAGIEARTEARDRMGLLSAQVAYDQASRALQVGQFDRAMKEIVGAIERSPRQPSFHVLQGRIFLEQHRLEPALRSFELAIELGAEAEKSRRSQIHANAHMTDAPVGADRPTIAQAHYLAGVVHQRWSDHSRAFVHYNKAAEIDPSSASYLLAAAESLISAGRLDEAEELVRPRLSYFEHSSAMRQLLGQIAMLRGDTAAAERLLAQARVLSPDDAMLVEELARVQFAAGMYSQCFESLQLLRRMRNQPLATASRSRPSGTVPQAPRPDLLLLEARCLVMLDRPIEARSRYMEVTDMAPGEVEPWIELGAVAWAIGDHRRLSSAGSRIVAIAPERWEGYFLQAMFERSTNDQASNDPQRSARVRQLLTKAANRAQAATTGGAGPALSSVLPHLMLGQVLEEQGEPALAKAAYAQAMRLNPGDRHAHELFGKLSAAPIE